MATDPQSQWQGWLDKGYIDYTGWVPEHYQVGVAEQYGLTGAGNPFYGGINPMHPEYLGAQQREGQWKVESEQDILDYLAFANEMATHNKQRLAKLGIADYTGQDVADFFTTPGEKARVEASKVQTLGDIARAGALSSSESGKYRRSIQGGNPALLGAQEGMAAQYAKPSHEGILTTAAYETARGIEGGRRTGDIERLLMAAELGGGAHIGAQETASQAATAPLAAGAAGIASGNPIGMIAGGATAAGALPFVIGGADQARIARDALTKKRVALNLGSIVLPNWSTGLKPIAPTAVASARPYGGNQVALSGMYEDSGRGQRNDGIVWG